MSTPITHNALFVLATYNTVGILSSMVAFNEGGKCDDELVCEVVKECVALYNYPDAVQALHRPDGSILTRRVTHFESAKESGKSPNWHKLFSPDYLEIAQDNDTIWWNCFHDSGDQTGDVMGQYTDWYAWNKEKADYFAWASRKCNCRALLLVELVGAHLEVADWLNDKMFRMYVSQLDDGSIMIGTAKFGPDEKQKAFGLFKGLIMSLQEQSAVITLEDIFDDVTPLNDAVENSYRTTFSPWLADNSLKFVKPFSYDEFFEPSNEQLQLLSKAGIEYEDLEAETDRFIQDATYFTTSRILGAMDYISSIQQEILK